MTDTETIATLRGLIAQVEWRGFADDYEVIPACPWCRTCADGPHSPDCPAAQAMGWRMRA